MNVWALFGYVIFGAVVGYVAVAVGRRFIPQLDGYCTPRKEVERQRALWAIRLEYAGKVDPSLLDSVEHSPHSPEHVRQILDDHIETSAMLDRQLEDLRRRRNSQ